MNILEQLLKFRYYILGVLLLCLASYLSPNFLNILAYFKPLLIYAAAVLSIAFFFAYTFPPKDPIPPLPKPAEELLNLVAEYLNHLDSPTDKHD
ncbi:hypothetical protein SESBI_01386 [Sesbania bispinosa]|nr:hypothetical protein SESBI_01386 [Sesbania bispinosa]